MHEGVLSCGPDATLAEIASTMAEHRVHAVVVEGARRDASHDVWGIVSDLDIVGRCGAPDVHEVRARDLAATPAVVIGRDATLAEAARLMHDYDIHHLLVAEPGDRRPVGVLSTLDIAAAMAASLR